MYTFLRWRVPCLSSIHCESSLVDRTTKGRGRRGTRRTRWRWIERGMEGGMPNVQPPFKPATHPTNPPIPPHFLVSHCLYYLTGKGVAGRTLTETIFGRQPVRDWRLHRPRYVPRLIVDSPRLRTTVVLFSLSLLVSRSPLLIIATSFFTSSRECSLPLIVRFHRDLIISIP